MKTRSLAVPVRHITDRASSLVWRRPFPTVDRTLLPLAGIAALIVAWLAAILYTNVLNFVIVAPSTQTGFEAFLTLGLLFGALILFLIPDPPVAARMRWVAGGLVLFALGALFFGFLYPVLDRDLQPGSELYGFLLIRTVGMSYLVIGLLPSRPPRFHFRILAGTLTGVVALSLALLRVARELPILVRAMDQKALEAARSSTVPGTTPWHWILATIPLVLGVFATAGAYRHFRFDSQGMWLTSAMVVLTGAMLHSMFWPTLSSTMLTTSSVLRLVFTIIVLVGGLLELHHLLLDRIGLLAAEQENTRQLQELTTLKDDFTAMVAHELASPLAAISALASVSAIDNLPADRRARTSAALHDEIKLLNTLVADVQTAIAIEGEGFTCHPCATPTRTLIDRAMAFAETLPTPHAPLVIDASVEANVLADPDRIEQVLRNLIGNAYKYTPRDTTVTLRVSPFGEDRIQFAVIDQGMGIAPADQARIFGKYERGTHQHRISDTGRGLGLYLSRNIVRLHQTELSLRSAPGQGSCFSFVLRQLP